MLEEAMQGVNMMKEPAPSEEAKESSDTSSEDQTARIMGYNTERSPNRAPPKIVERPEIDLSKSIHTFQSPRKPKMKIARKTVQVSP